MRIFSKLYNYMMRWSRHPHAVYYLGCVSFIESSLFPIPPDVMLAPMALATPSRAWWYATVTTVTSVLGALFGYLLGMFFFHWLSPVLVHMGYWPAYLRVQAWFIAWGGWLMFIAGVSPIPFKLFTIAGGALHMPLPLFVVGSMVGRGMRFYAVAGLMRWGGAPMEQWLKRCIDWLGWSIVALLGLGYGLYYWYG